VQLARSGDGRSARRNGVGGEDIGLLRIDLGGPSGRELEVNRVHDACRAVHVVGAEGGADFLGVRRTVVDVGVIVVQGEEVDGDLRRDQRAAVHGDAVDGQGGEDAPVDLRIGGQQLVPQAPDAAREQVAAVVGFAGAGILEVVIRVSEAGGAATREADGHGRLIGYQHHDAVGHALAVLVLPAAAHLDDVVSIFMVDHSREGRVRIADSTRLAEVDGSAAVPGVARAVAIRAVDADREVRLSVDGGVCGMIKEDIVSHGVGLDVAVDLCPHKLVGVGLVVHEVGRAGRGDVEGQGLLRSGNVVNVEVLAGHRGLHGDGRAAGIGDGEVAVRVGVDARGSDGGPGIGHRGRCLGAAEVGSEAFSGHAADVAGHVGEDDEVFEIEHFIVGRVHDKPPSFGGGGVGVILVVGDEGDGQDRLDHHVVHAGPDDDLQRGEAGHPRRRGRGWIEGRQVEHRRWPEVP